MFHGLLGEIVAAADPSTEADPVGVYVNLHAGVGALAGQGPHVLVGNTRHPLLIWPLLFGRTGTGRKGEASETSETFLRHACPDEFLQISVSGLSSGEGLIERIRDPESEEDSGGAIDKRLYVLEPEFASVMARAKREGSTLATVLRLAWDGKPLSVLNRHMVRASASHVAIVGHITPREFRLRLADADLAGGTFNRFLPIWVERSKRLPIPEGVSALMTTQYGHELERAISRARGVGRLRLSRSASELWSERLYDELTDLDDDDHSWTEFTRRAAPYCLRVAALHSAIEGRALIEAAELMAAATLVRYSIASARYVLTNQRNNPRIDRIIRAVDAAGERGRSRSEISALFGRNLGKEILDALLNELIRDGSYVRIERQTGGRPAVFYAKAHGRG